MKALFPLLFFLLTITVSPQEQEQAQIPPETNDPVLPELLKDFYDSSRQYRVAHIPEMENVTGVYFIKSDLNMLGDISEDGTKIYLNEELKLYPSMTKIILYRQLGKLYRMPADIKKGHAVMGLHWKLDLRHELYARHLERQEWYYRKFFESLEEQNPIKKRL